MSPTLGLVFFILGSLYSGIATPTEAAALSAFAAAVMAVVSRSLTWNQFVDALVSTCRLTSFIVLIIIGATILNCHIIYEATRDDCRRCELLDEEHLPDPVPAQYCLRSSGDVP